LAKRRSKAEKERHLELEHRSVYRFSILHALTSRAVAGSFAKKFGLNFAAWRTLTVIGRFEPIFPGGVGQWMSLGSDRVARAVDELVRKGLVARRPDGLDRRRIALTLTPEGRRVYRTVDRERQTQEKIFLSVLTPDEARIFHACMDKLEAQARIMYGRRGGGKRSERELEGP
jgi:DNA-binding MarR family transcriptional regulator